MISHSSSFVFGGKTVSQMRTPEITAHVAVRLAVRPLNITTHMHAKNTHDITATATHITFVALSILVLYVLVNSQRKLTGLALLFSLDL